MIRLGILNSSPIIALRRCGQETLLPKLIETIIIPTAVVDEVGDPPPYAKVESAPRTSSVSVFPRRIHRGECEVIMLGMKFPGSVLILDDLYARRFAESRHLVVSGTIGLLIRAHRTGLIEDFWQVMEQLERQGFRMSERLLKQTRRILES